ncbi:hypothetical protein A3C28_04225 [Candidatus Roizmanbacteria bacterium RIFCSPHIGHO2_02_FULL_39_9]|uniref:7-carboxy-7-deazaguanine synthase n=2 Tax=Candidatus Roizmaniibacteriota TaxID=1752723 RepID=A0A1F7I248_9BACT|nr:MAG: hypothetical protein A3C28_04225 [Candidatus Roizmanbacteria bacterium RIFCSPHIGHO2_02_FULL_39_9]OGK37427.1 MAG: hypothetical protein A3F60_00670 [Candidatus Roizmanbacteria bacterium RIFCSPHIGHO2_12_FULL_39_8]
MPLLAKKTEMKIKKNTKRASDFLKSKVPKKYKDFDKLRMMEECFKVSGDGVFYTVQGEGISTGLPSCFLRLHTCNLRCVWCDTWYTWNHNTKEFWTEFQDWTIEKTKEKIEKTWGCENSLIQKRLVITGGEPLIQKNKIDKLVELMPGWVFEVETNGTIMPTENMLKKFQFNCSPKLQNSLNPKAARIKKDVLIHLNKVNTMFKFVVTSAKDLEEIENDFIRPFSLDVNRIVVMPQGITSDELQINMRKIVEAVKKRGYRLMGRLQCEIWGGRRKV